MGEVTVFQTGFRVNEALLQPGDIFRKADASLWEVKPDGSQAPLGAGGGSQPGMLRIIKSELLTVATSGLNNGIDFSTAILGGDLPIGSIIYDVWPFVPTAFDGTSPQADIGLYQSGDAAGFYGIPGEGPIDLTIADSTQLAHGTKSRATGLPAQPPLSQCFIQNIDWGYLPTTVEVAGPLFVVASQDGLKGGAALDSAHGGLIVCALVATF